MTIIYEFLTLLNSISAGAPFLCVLEVVHCTCRVLDTFIITLHSYAAIRNKQRYISVMLCFLLFAFLLATLGSHRTKLNQTLRRVWKSDRSEMHIYDLRCLYPLDFGAKTAYFGLFSTTLQICSEYRIGTRQKQSKSTLKA